MSEDRSQDNTQTLSFIREAIRLAVENVRSGRGGPFACVIVRDGNVIASGTNLVTTSNDPTAHAEIVAIRRACEALGSFQLTGCDVYTSCEPCPMCLGALYWARPARVFFAASHADAAAAGFDDAMILREMALPFERRQLRMMQIGGDEGMTPFDAWRSQEGKIAY